MLSSQEFSSSKDSMKMFSQALQSELFRFNSLSSKIVKIPEFNLQQLYAFTQILLNKSYRDLQHCQCYMSMKILQGSSLQWYSSSRVLSLRNYVLSDCILHDHRFQKSFQNVLQVTSRFDLSSSNDVAVTNTNLEVIRF